MVPTTKAKQRDFLDTLIDAIAKGLPREDILRQLRVLRRQLHNRPAKHGRVTAPWTPTQKPSIIKLRLTHPEMSMQEISQRLGISIGRVSETLSGKRV